MFEFRGTIRNAFRQDLEELQPAVERGALIVSWRRRADRVSTNRRNERG